MYDSVIKIIKVNSFFIPLLFAITLATAQTADAPYLCGIHWYLNTDSLSVGQHTDVEDMSGDKGIWVMEIAHMDAGQAPVWSQPSYFVSHCQKASVGKGHSFIFRIHPFWSRNVPHASDPYTLANYADDARAAADTLKDYVHIWQIGNEVNINGENLRWGGSGYDTQWQPTPAQYAATYEAVRDKIHEITPNTTPATQIACMQPVSPGEEIASIRFYDGNEFLWEQIEAVSDPAKIDGFALHGYAEPGGANFGVEGFMDSIREQIMIIDQLGLQDRPIYITEFNKHMPNVTEANVGAKFLHRAYTALNDWNAGTGGALPGLANHNIVTATWFVYPGGVGWDDYSLQYWKSNIASTDEELNPWHSFNYAAGLAYAKGTDGGGDAVPQSDIWWADEFDGSSVDTTGPLPDWTVENGVGGSSTVSGGMAVLRGNGGSGVGGSLRTRGYVFGNFRLETEIEITDAARSNTSNSEANFDLRIREGTRGYSLTFFTGGSNVNTSRIILRRTNDWTQIGSYNVQVPGGINNGDEFRVTIIADGPQLDITVSKNGAGTPVVDWTVIDGGQSVGWLRLMTWNLAEARVDFVRMGGPQWDGASGSGVEGWIMF